MSHRKFTGWTPTTEITHEYDEGTGRLVRSLQWTESEWSAQEQGWMLAYAEYESTRCGGCGGDSEETFHNDSQFAYDVGPPHRCHRCTAIAKAADQYAKDGGEHLHALRFVPVRR